MSRRLVLIPEAKYKLMKTAIDKMGKTDTDIEHTAKAADTRVPSDNDVDNVRETDDTFDSSSATIAEPVAKTHHVSDTAMMRVRHQSVDGEETGTGVNPPGRTIVSARKEQYSSDDGEDDGSSDGSDDDDYELGRGGDKARDMIQLGPPGVRVAKIVASSLKRPKNHVVDTVVNRWLTYK